MATLNENLLDSWIDLSLTISNEKLVSDLPYNEALICHILNRHEKTAPPKPMTATALCKRTKMQKSQMNRTLSAMEKRGLIFRERSPKDKRQIFVRLVSSKDNLYFRQHQKIIALVDHLIEKMGVEKARSLMDTLRTLTVTAGGIIK